MCIGTELTRDERVQIYTHLQDNLSVSEIAKKMCRHRSTIYRELKKCKDRNSEYNFELSQKIRDKNIETRVRDLAIKKNRKLANYIDCLIIEQRLSPAAAIGKIKNENEFNDVICFKTVYNYIENGYLMSTRANLYRFGKRRVKKIKAVERGKFTKGTPIEQRPSEINERKDFGHFEADLVLGGKTKGAAILTLTERVSRFNFDIKIPNKKQESVIAGFDTLERFFDTRYNLKFKDIIKSITFDNGIEFMNHIGIERSCLNDSKRTETYYAHAYSSHERGTNERNNGMLRQFGLTKGINFNELEIDELKDVTDKLNNYPRGIFEYHCASEIFSKLSGLPQDIQTAFMVA